MSVRFHIARSMVFVAVAMSLLAAVSCRPASSWEAFGKLGAEGGRVEFVLPLTDTACTYDISFYARLDGPGREKEGFPVEVKWTSPSGDEYVEKVFFPACGEALRFSDKLTSQLYAPYRSCVRPVEAGGWGLELAVAPVDGMRGIGVVCERIKDNGTR